MVLEIRESEGKGDRYLAQVGRELSIYLPERCGAGCRWGRRIGVGRRLKRENAGWLPANSLDSIFVTFAAHESATSPGSVRYWPRCTAPCCPVAD